MKFDELSDIIGPEAAIELCKAAGGGEVYIPSPETVSKLLRARSSLSKARGYRDQGLTIKEVAEVLGLSQSAAWRLLQSNN